MFTLKSVFTHTAGVLFVLTSCLANAQDFFNGNEAIKISDPIKLTSSHHVRDYPILRLGSDSLVMHAKQSFATGTGLISLGRIYVADIRNKKFFAAIDMTANLNESSGSSDWNDEPCKREDYAWKRSTGGKFTNVNCASIVHITSFFTNPTGDFQQLLVKFRDLGVEIPPTIVRASFTRYTNNGRRLVYLVSINPEQFGVDRDADIVWGSNSWYKDFLIKDPRKVQFISNLSKWAEEVQNRMDNAFLKKQDAFIDLPSFESFFKDKSAIGKNNEILTETLEERLKTVKSLYEKKLLNEDQYNEQVRLILSTK